MDTLAAKNYRTYSEDSNHFLVREVGNIQDKMKKLTSSMNSGTKVVSSHCDSASATTSLIKYFTIWREWEHLTYPNKVPAVSMLFFYILVSTKFWSTCLDFLWGTSLACAAHTLCTLESPVSDWWLVVVTKCKPCTQQGKVEQCGKSPACKDKIQLIEKNKNKVLAEMIFFFNLRQNIFAPNDE